MDFIFFAQEEELQKYFYRLKKDISWEKSNNSCGRFYIEVFKWQRIRGKKEKFGI